MEFDYKIIEDKFKQLPEEIQMAMTSTDVTKLIKKIGDRHGLRIDQESILYDLTSYVMLGLIPSKEFVKTLSKEAGVEELTSKKIAEDINMEVLSQIKSGIQATQTAQSNDVTSEHSNATDIASIERAGGFSIERGGLENAPAYPDNHTDPLADHLLSKPVATTEQKTTFQMPDKAIPPPTAAQTKPAGPDPYREPVQ